MCMFGILKFFYFLYKKVRSILDPNLNPLRHAPIYVRWLASIILFCFWCLAFGLYIGEPLSIPYNMLGHIAVISMAFVTWAVFKQANRIYGPKEWTQDWLRMPDRSSRRIDSSADGRDVQRSRHLLLSLMVKKPIVANSRKNNSAFATEISAA